MPRPVAQGRRAKLGDINWYEVGPLSVKNSYPKPYGVHVVKRTITSTIAFALLWPAIARNMSIKRHRTIRTFSKLHSKKPVFSPWNICRGCTWANLYSFSEVECQGAWLLSPALKWVTPQSGAAGCLGQRFRVCAACLLSPITLLLSGTNC